MTTRRFTDNTTQALLEAALERLTPGETTLPKAIPYRNLIPEIAHHLTTLYRKDAPVTYPADQLKRVVSQLKPMASWIQKDEDLGHSEPSTIRAGDLNLPLPLRLRLIRFATEAGDLAEKIESILSHDHAPRRRRARPKHTASRKIALYLHQETERLTGRIPGRSVAESGIDQSSRERGDFVVLVREIFKILGVRASPEYAAKIAVEEAKTHGDKSKKRQI
jgi:hypothetical protein